MIVATAPANQPHQVPSVVPLLLLDNHPKSQADGHQKTMGLFERVSQASGLLFFPSVSKIHCWQRYTADLGYIEDR